MKIYYKICKYNDFKFLLVYYFHFFISFIILFRDVRRIKDIIQKT